MENNLNIEKNNVLQMEVNDEKDNGNPKVSVSDRIKNFFTYFTVEPFLFCYLLPNIIASITTIHFNVRKACHVDLGYNESVCDKVANTDLSDNETITVFLEAQKLVANMSTWSLPLQYGVPAIMILFVGAWSDRTGNRKILMMLPIIGELISTVGMILAIYYFSVWPLWVTGIIECLPTAISGGLSVALMGGYSYIADITDADSRTFRMGIVGVIVSLSIPAGTTLGGVLTEKCGYYVVYSIILAFYIIGFLYIVVRIKDVGKIETEGEPDKRLIAFFDPQKIWYTVSKLYKRQSQLLQVLLVILAHIVIMGPVFGESSVLYLYVTNKFGMDVVEFSLFSTYSILMGIAGSAVAVTIFCKLLKLSDHILGIIGSSCKVMSSFMYGFAVTKQWFYSGPVLDFFGGTGVLAIRSLGTKLVGQKDTGKFCSILGLVEGLGPAIYGPLYNKLYSETLETTPGAFYIIGGVMTVPAIFIFIYLYFDFRKAQKDIVKNPEEKEKYAHENFITAL